MAGSDAQAGFYYQNIVAAGFVLELLDIGSPVKTVSLENPKRAKFVDDIIVERTDKTVFLQIKWANDDSAALTLHNLVATDEDSDIALIAKLASGFKRICGESGTKEILLLSTKKPGTNKQKAKGFPKSLHEFLCDLHNPFIAETASSDIRLNARFSDYEDILERLRQASGLKTSEEFYQFLRILRFRLGHPDRATMETKVRAKLELLGIVQTQYATLLDHVVKWSIDQATIKAGDVLQSLGLSNHFIDPIKHDFPVDARHWVRTPTIFRALDQALRNLRSGFILLEGEPGIGKSTLLAAYKARRKDVTFSYYCYVPDDRFLGNDRLEQAAFVRSLCISLSKTFPDLGFPHPYKEYSLEHLNSWLSHVSQRNKRVVFIVDGLNHVHHKQRQSLILQPLTSVLDNLPPENVFFILSSQYLTALPNAVQDHIQSDPRRHIRVPRFGLSQIKAFLSQRGVELKAQNLQLAQTVSGGVPVYLEYLASRLADLNEFGREEFLKAQPSLRGDTIEKYHRYLWDHLQTDQAATHALALLAFRRDFTTLDDLVELLQRLNVPATHLSVQAAIRSIAHVLRESEGNAFAIRHNRFREFVLEQTAVLGTAINEMLADWYAAHPASDEAWRHRFRHLFELGKYDELKNLCNYDWLLNSWTTYRPIAEINQNIDLAWKSAAITEDLASFVRIALIKQRLALAEQNLDLTTEQIACFLVDLGSKAKALMAVWDGERPQCSPSAFADFCLYYRSRFGSVPPNPVIQAALSDHPVEASSADLSTYYRACTYIQPALPLLQYISGLSWTIRSEYKPTTQPVSDSARKATNLTLQFAVIRELLNSSKLSELVQIEGAETKLIPEVLEFARAIHALLLARIGESDEARVVASTVNLASIPEPDRRSLLLDLASRGVWNSAWFTDADPPSLPAGFVHESFRQLAPEIFSLYDRFRFHFLSNKEGRAWLDTVLTGLSEPNKSIVHALGKLALLWAGWVRQGNKSVRAVAQFQEILTHLDLSPTLFQHLSHASHLAKSLYADESPSLFAYVWNAAIEMLDPTDLLTLGQWWATFSDGHRAVKNADATRDFAVRLSHSLKSSADPVVRPLLALAERAARTDKETSVLVSQIFASAKAWGRCGFAAEAAGLWKELLNLGCGIAWRKDYQFNEILAPLALAHERNPQATRQRIADQLALAHRLEGAARSKTVEIAIEDLITFASRISPALSLRMLRHEEKSIYRERALLSLVKQWIKSTDISLRWLWALASTAARWDSYSEYNEYTRPMREAVFAAALERGDFAAAEAIYRDARHVFLVEKDTPGELARCAQLWADIGEAPAQVLADTHSFIAGETTDASNNPHRERLLSPDPQMTRPTFCTRASERVYNTTSD